MTALAVQVADQVLVWGSGYTVTGLVIRGNALRALRRGPGAGGPVYASEIPQWYEQEVPALTLKARLWYLWPLALRKATDAELSRYEARATEAQMRRLEMEREKLQARLDRERAWDDMNHQRKDDAR